MPGLWGRSLAGGTQEATDRCFSHTLMFLSFFLPPFPSLRIKTIFLKKKKERKADSGCCAENKRLWVKGGRVRPEGRLVQLPRTEAVLDWTRRDQKGPEAEMVKSIPELSTHLLSHRS